MQRHRKLIMVLAALLAALMVIPLLLSAFSMTVGAASSDEIKSELDTLKEQAAQISAQAEQAQSAIKDNEQQTTSVVDQKAAIDQQIAATQEQIDNTNDQIQQYSLLIAGKEDELNEAQDQQETLYAQYKTRIRTMEETGDISYWSILFGSKSFSDLLDRIDLIGEITNSDQQMLDQLEAAQEQIAQQQTELESDKSALDDAKASLSEQETELSQQRTDADNLITSLSSENGELKAAYEEIGAQEDTMAQEILDKTNAYNEAVTAEEAAKKKAEEEAATKAAAAAQSSGDTASSSGTASASGFLFPLPAGCATITDAFGMRYHPIYGYYRMHTGVDLACNAGTTVYASKSGTIMTSEYSSVYGNYIQISHSDGTSTVYEHLSSALVSAGESVSQGEAIGYVGSTGWSTGPHLHFEIIVGGEYQNPMNYVSLNG